MASLRTVQDDLAALARSDPEMMLAALVEADVLVGLPWMGGDGKCRIEVSQPVAADTWNLLIERDRREGDHFET